MSRKTLGLRERQARKRRFRGGMFCITSTTSVGKFKAGRKHMLRLSRLFHRLTVAESEKRANGAPETN